MASVDEDNKPQGAQSHNSQGGKNLLSFYKKLRKEEEHLTDKKTSFAEKIPTLVTVWQSLKDFIQDPQPKSVDRIIEWAQRHTLNLVLHGDWASTPSNLKCKLFTVVEEFDKKLSSCTQQLTTRRCKNLIEVIKDPWGDVTLCKILNEPEKCCKQEELDFFSSENGYILAMRLKKLCDSHCEDLALRFANACLRTLRSPESQNFNVVTTEDQKRYIIDVYIALLYKYKRTHDIIQELKHLSLEEGFQLVQRFTKKRVELSRLWKHCASIAELAAKFFITAAMLKPIQQCSKVLPELLKSWLELNDKLEGLPAVPVVLRRIIQTADSSAHIYICCELLNKQYGKKIKSFTIELYIRALTTDMNEREKQKQAVDNKKVEETSKRLADGFLSLADVLQDNLYVSRECVLTSFSVNPTWTCMERIENLAISCGALAERQESECSKDKVKTVDNDKNNLINSDKSAGTKVPPIDTGQVSAFSNSELSRVLVPQTLGLSEQLCDDLAVILSSPRYQLLSWVMPWPELKTACNSYLVNTERHVVKELKYLNIDYNQFKDWPKDCPKRCEYGGIEKGYEQYTEDENISNTESDYMSYEPGFNDSDSSLNVGKRRKKERKIRKIYSSDSDFDIGHRGRLRDNSSDLDTGSQDMDSLGSDGLQNTYTNNKSNISPKRSETISPFSLLMKGRNQENRKLLGLFNRDIDNTSALISSFILPNKKSPSDPKTLKTLRMFRSNKKKNKDIDLSPLVNENQNQNINQNTVNENQVKVEALKQIVDGKVQKLPLTANLNPRVLLNRLDKNETKEKCVSKDISAIKENNTGPTAKASPQKFPEIDKDARVVLNRYDDLLKINRTYSKLQEKQRLNEKLTNVPGLSNISKDNKSDNVQNTAISKFPEIDKNARVMLNRYDDLYSVYKNSRNYNNLHEKSRQLEVLADVPGLNSLEMIRPSVVQPTIQVVQVTTNLQNTQIRPAKSQTQSSTTTTSNIITSTPVTAHIQRVGNAPTTERPVESDPQENQSPSPSQNSNESRVSIVSPDNGHQSETPSPVTPATKPSNSQATPTLVNILSQQIPAQSNATTNRNSTLINILSQQIIKPPRNQIPQKIFNVATSSVEGVVNISVSNPEVTTTTAASVVTSVGQLQLQNSIKLVTTQSQPVAFQHIINAQGKNNNQVIKNVNLVTNSANPVDATRLVQFLCKTDGKVVHLTPYPNANIKLQTFDPSKLIKTTTVISKPATMQSTSQIPISSPVRSSYEENFTKFIQTNTRTIPVKTVQDFNTSTNEDVANSLPKFQQAFGKAGYQVTTSTTVEPNIEIATSNVVVTTVANSETDTISKSPGLVTTVAKTVSTTALSAKPIITSKSAITSLGVQTIQGGVIYRQVPVSLAISSSEQINLIPASTVAQATVINKQINVTKDNIIMRNKMSQLLAAALQSNLPNRSSAVVSAITTSVSTSVAKTVTDTTVASSTYNNINKQNEIETCDVDSSSSDSTCITTTVANTTPTLVTPMRITLPVMQRTPGPNGMQTRIVRPILQIPQSMIRTSTGIRQQVLLATATPVAMTGVVACTPQQTAMPIEENLLTTNIEGTGNQSVSSTTLEQLREFDLVLEQVKERSTVNPTTPTIQNKVQVVQKPPITVNTDLQEISNVSVAYMNPTPLTQIGQKVTSCASVVVVTSYCNVQPAASPALSVTSQSSSSPCVTPAPSAGKTVSKTSAKSPKSKNSKPTAHTSKTSPVPKPQQKPQEDEQTTQRIFDILAEYAEQLRNSPDLNNKPAPRRRSNPPTNPSQNSKRKKCSSKKSVSVSQCNSISELSPGTDDPRTMGSEDSCGIVQLSVQNSPQEVSMNDDQSAQCSTDFSSVRNQTESTEPSTVETQGRQFIFTDSNTNQQRNVIIADSAVSETLVGKLSNTAAVIVPANYIVPMVKGGQQIAVVSGSSKILATVPARSGSNMLLFQSFVNQSRKPITAQGNIKTVKYSTVQPIQGQIISAVNTQTPVVLSPSTETVTLSRPLSFKKIGDKTQIITTDTSKSTDNIITTTNLGGTSTVTSQKCNVILASGNVTDLNNLNVISENSSSGEQTNEADTSEDSTKVKTECIKIMPMCDTITTGSGDIKIIDSSQGNLIQNQSFSLNFTTKDSSIPVFTQIVSEGNASDDKVEIKIENDDNDKEHHNVITTIIDNGSSDKIVSTSSSNYSRMDCSPTVDHYSKLYIEDKKKSNTNGPMLGQTDSEAHPVIRRDADKVVRKRKLRVMSDGASYNYKKKVQGMVRTEKDMQQRKQEAMERELCLQKSLSEECEDLGVDEPSTSDLFPEADLLFDSNNSPSFDQLSQDIDKKYAGNSYQIDTSCSNEEFKKEDGPKKSIKMEIKEEQHCDHRRDENGKIEVKDEPHDEKVALFSDSDNSDSTLRTDLLFETLDYPSAEAEIEYSQRDKSQLTNGSKDGLQSSSYDEHSIMDANSDEYISPLMMHKYKYKYCNRKRLMSTQNSQKEKSTEEWENTQSSNVMPVIKMLSSDEDTSESIQKSVSRSPTPKRSASPSWDENESNHSYKNLYNSNSNKILKVSLHNLSESVVCETENRKSLSDQCTLDCLDSTTPPSPLSPEDGDINSYGVGRSARRSTQRVKKKCPCCSPEKPKKMTLKKLPKGQINKKR